MKDLPITNKHLWKKYNETENSYYILNENKSKEEFCDCVDTAFLRHTNTIVHAYFKQILINGFEGIKITYYKDE